MWILNDWDFSTMTWVTKLCLPYTRGWFPTTVLMALICTISVQKATTGNYVFLWLDKHVSLSKSQTKTSPRVIHKFVPVIKWLSLTRLTLASKLICMYFQSNSTPLAPTHRGTRRVMISSAVAQPKIKEKKRDAFIDCKTILIENDFDLHQNESVCRTHFHK